jgi:hypothetical protein
VLPQTSHAICEIPPTRLQPSRKNITKRLKGGVEKKNRFKGQTSHAIYEIPPT